MSIPLKYKKILLPIIILAVTLFLMMMIFKNPPTSKREKQSKSPQITVAISTIMPKAYQVMVQSFGTVKPRTQSVLFAQVPGQITKISKQFRAGGFFEKGDILVQLDDRDYRAEVSIAQASLFSAKQQLQEENARVKQAKADWKRLGNGKVPSPLVLRQPQLEAAKAQVLSADAKLNKVKLSLERTKIVAPYAGRVLKQKVDIGQVVSSNTQLADIFAVDYVEIRLPIKNKDLPLMQLPEEYQNAHEQSDNELEAKSNVVIKSDLMGEQTWKGSIVRTESAIDEMSQQLYVVAQIIRPYSVSSRQNQAPQIKIGQYVTANITGRTLENTLVIPSSAVYQGSYIYIVENGLLLRKNVELAWQNGTESIVSNGLNAGDQLVLTPLGQVSSGTPVAIEGQPLSKRDRDPSHTQTKKEIQSSQVPKHRLKRLEKIAAERGITVEELIAERKAGKAVKPIQHNNANEKVKVNNE